MDSEVRMAEPPKGYALSGKIMLSAIVILFAVVVFMVGLHLYARWYLVRLRRRQIERRRHRRHQRTHIVFYTENHQPGSAVAANRGLEPGVLSSLPVFVYSSTKNQPVASPLECAVCLSEFEENEIGRRLPKCHHSFHIECIDMWFHSHSTCPLCRSPVEPVPDSVVDVLEPVVDGNRTEHESSSSSELCAPCHNEGRETVDDATSLAARRKVLDSAGVRIEVPTRSELDNELPPSSPGFRSPGTRLLCLKRILSMGMRSPAGASCTTPSAAGTIGGAVGAAAEFDLECGLAESTQQLTQVQTPR